METLLLQALIRQSQGDRQRSLDLLQQALQIPRQGNYIRLFLDEGKPMADLLTCAAAKPNPAREISPLTGSLWGRGGASLPHR
jgi:LuxR family maltose regulon positive regulatory protein